MFKVCFYVTVFFHSTKILMRYSFYYCTELLKFCILSIKNIEVQKKFYIDQKKYLINYKNIKLRTHRISIIMSKFLTQYIYNS